MEGVFYDKNIQLKCFWTEDGSNIPKLHTIVIVFDVGVYYCLSLSVAMFFNKTYAQTNIS
ncbi:hypothetical protein TUM16655_39900 [Enterobacter cloacae]|jgi:hypothetical protein|nr:hypothetical protein TUM16655_39900 [Enterobacter cloacae]